MSKKILHPCPDCGKKRPISVEWAKKNSRCLSCSTKNLGWRGENHPHWKGGRTIDATGYARVRAVGHPLAHKCGYILEHRLIACNKWGVEAVRDMIVHHRDGDISNNDINNLELISQPKHSRLHNKTTSSDTRITGEPNPIIRCRCGCNNTFMKYDKKGRPRKYKHGHRGIPV